MDNTKKGENYYQKNEEISRGKALTNTWKLILYILTITDVFLNQKRVDVCEHAVKMEPHEFLITTQGLRDRKGGVDGEKN